MSLEIFLNSIAEVSASPPTTDFIEVSDLNTIELGQFAIVWDSLPVDRQRIVISTMVELAEDNPELDFCAIYKLCLKQDDEDVLGKAIEGLWEYEDRSIIPGLVQILKSPKSPIVRAAAAIALGKFPTLAEEGKILHKDSHLVQENLMAALQDSNEHLEVRRRSLEAAAPFNTDEVKHYISWAYKSEDLDLKSSAIYAMGQTGDTSWLPILINELQNHQPSILYETARACGQLGDEDVVPYLIPLLQEDDYHVQLGGIAALGKIGGSLAKRVLLSCIKDGDAALEEAAQTALDNLGSLGDSIAFSSQH
jgi:HEAT repeat protein